MKCENKRRRGPVIGSKHTLNVPLVELLRIFSANATIQVGRRWAEQNGINLDEPTKPLALILAEKNGQLAQKNDEIRGLGKQLVQKIEAAKVAEVVAPVPVIHLNVSDPSLEFEE
jgi:hypothetical protein